MCEGLLIRYRQATTLSDSLAQDGYRTTDSQEFSVIQIHKQIYTNFASLQESRQAHELVVVCYV